jgi:hypothetical protein
MDELEVTCIVKRDRYSEHERIEAIGGGRTLLGSWRRIEEEAIVNIEWRRCSYFVMVNYQRVNVIVAQRYGRKYLRTEPDDYRPNNLLSLPICT